MEHEHDGGRDATTWDEYDFPIQIREPLDQILDQRGERAGDTWLWCLHCNRFFQARHLRIDFFGNRQGCAFCKCAGFDVAIFEWHVWKEPHWPQSEDELRHGLQCS